VRISISENFWRSEFDPGFEFRIQMCQLCEDQQQDMNGHFHHRVNGKWMLNISRKPAALLAESSSRAPGMKGCRCEKTNSNTGAGRCKAII
jgi:hypothetical protein